MRDRFRHLIFWFIHKWVRVLAAVLLLVPIIWGTYLLLSIWRTESQIHSELPWQAVTPFEGLPTAEPLVVSYDKSHAVTTDVAKGTEQADPGPGSVRIASPPGPTTGAPTPYIPGFLPSNNPTTQPSGETITSWNGRKRANVLLVGIDRRGQGPARSDTIILASLDFEHSKASILSVPRDLYVDVPGFRYWKINAAYAIGEDRSESTVQGGGIGLLINTIRLNFGIDYIDEYAVVDFQGFVKAVDALGGVDVTVPERLVDDKYQHAVFDAGPHHLNGDKALQYVRIRHPDSDFARMRRQQQVLLALRQRISPATLLSAPSLLRILGDHVTTSLTTTEQITLARWTASLSLQQLEFYSIEGPIGVNDRGESVVYADWSRIDPVLQKVFGPQAGHR